MERFLHTISKRGNAGIVLMGRATVLYSDKKKVRDETPTKNKTALCVLIDEGNFFIERKKI